jgi:hypothetical protein
MEGLTRGRNTLEAPEGVMPANALTPFQLSWAQLRYAVATFQWSADPVELRSVCGQRYQATVLARVREGAVGDGRRLGSGAG